MLKFKHFTLGLLVLLQLTSFAQGGWNANFGPRKVFVENKGQFDQFANTTIGTIKYAADFGETRVFFGTKGVQYYFLETKKIPREEREKLASSINVNSPEKHKQWERLVGKFHFSSDVVNMRFEGNSKADLRGEDVTPDYHSYSFSNAKNEVQNVSNVKGFNKITYYNIYPKIDITYTVHPLEGIKYALTVRPGADISQVKFLFDRNIRLENGKIKIPTKFGDITDHEPVSFYEFAESQIVPSKFRQLNEKTIQFEVSNYDKKKTLVIDPWTQTPNFNTNWDIVWECERDGAGNVYILGGIMPMQVLKYDPTGNLQWTYNTPYDTSNVWLGTFATDLAGNTYITAGSTAQIQKINTSAALQWNNASPTGAISNAEFWTITFNCDQSQLVVGGTGGTGLTLRATVYNINTNSGAVLGSQNFAIGSTTAIPPTVQEVRAISAAPNGKYYYLTQDTVGSFNQNFNLCGTNNSSIFKNTSTYNLGYKCENFRYDNAGISALRANNQFFYTQNGTSVHKRSLQSGAIVATATIPGGNATSSLGKFQVNNSGLDLDDCGNVYVGTGNGVVKYDANLTQLATYTTAFRVYDVHVTSGGEIVACGGTGTSSTNSRTGGVQTFAAAACAPLAANCCDATICPVNVLCQNDAPVTLTAATAGGTWSGPGISANGTFNPVTAGVGTHTIVYTIACGADSISIVVSPCLALEACLEQNGSLTVSNGVEPYTWEYEQPATSTPITDQASCEACGHTWVPAIPFFGPAQCLNLATPTTTCNTPAQWVSFATGTTALPPAYPVRVTDNAGTVLIITSAAGLQPCNEIICPDVITTPNIQNVSCFGGSNGSVTVSSSAGTAPYTYQWSPNNTTGATVNNLTANNYQIITIDAQGCRDTIQITLTQPEAITLNVTDILGADCNTPNGTGTVTVAGGVAPYTYNWLPDGQTTASLNNLLSGNYDVTVTDANLCTANIAVIIPSNNGPSITNIAVTNGACQGNQGGQITVTATGGTAPLTYTLGTNPPQSTNVFSNVTAGTYTITVSDANGCNSTGSATITTATPITVTQGQVNNASCGQNNGSASVNVTNGSGNYTYVWSPNAGSTSTISQLASGVYSVTVTDVATGCTGSLTVNITGVGGANIDNTQFINPTCFGGTNGSITLEVSGGTTPYSFSINDGTPQSSNTFSNLGAGTYEVEVTDGAGCSAFQNITLITPPQLFANPGQATTLCQGESTTLTASGSGGVGPFTYTWSNGLTGNNPEVTPNTTTTYTLSVVDANGCQVTGTVIINVVPIPTALASPALAEGVEPYTVVFTNSSSNANNFAWDFGNGQTQNTNDLSSVTSTYNTGTYTVTLVASNGACAATWEGTVTVTPQPVFTIFVPNVFTPNDDPTNPGYGVMTENAVSQEAIIVNRWGNKMAELNAPNAMWDGTVNGKDAAEGVYFLKYKVISVDGREFVGQTFFHLQR
jgi:gliding motility-associated-like protein